MSTVSETTQMDPFPAGLLHADTFWDLLVRRVERNPNAPMLMDEHDNLLTYGEFLYQAERVAAALYERGVRAGTRVAWQLPTRIGTALVIGALARLGAIQAPIIPLYRERETGSAVSSAEAELLLVPGAWRGMDYVAMAETLPSRPRVEVVEHEPPANDEVGSLPPPPSSGGLPRWIYFTSGSSGLPKGAKHTDMSLLAAAHGFTVHGGIGTHPEEVGSIPFPIAHVGGVIYLMTVLMGGFPALLVEAFDPGISVETFRRYAVTASGGSTVFYTALLAEQRKVVSGTSLLPTLRVLKGGGAPCAANLFHAVRDELGATLAHDYGMTEVPMIAVARPSDSDEQLSETDGVPIPGVQVRVVDDTAVLPTGEDGEIQVSGTSVFNGYTDVALDSTAFTDDGWFRTGDIGHLHADGHLEVTGRIKEIIVRKGEKIVPVELETLLAEHVGVEEVAVLGLPDPHSGERVCAAITLSRSAHAPSLGELCEFLRAAGVMQQKLPEQLEVVSEIPRTGLGKADKLALRQRFTPA